MQKFLKVHKNTCKYTKVPESTQNSKNYAKVPESMQKNLKVSKSN